MDNETWLASEVSCTWREPWGRRTGGGTLVGWTAQCCPSACNNDVNNNINNNNNNNLNNTILNNNNDIKYWAKDTSCQVEGCVHPASWSIDTCHKCYPSPKHQRLLCHQYLYQTIGCGKKGKCWLWLFFYALLIFWELAGSSPRMPPFLR